jgi:hypothetical protein
VAESLKRSDGEGVVDAVEEALTVPESMAEGVAAPSGEAVEATPAPEVGVGPASHVEGEMEGEEEGELPVEGEGKGQEEAVGDCLLEGLPEGVALVKLTVPEGLTVEEGEVVREKTEGVKAPDEDLRGVKVEFHTVGEPL